MKNLLIIASTFFLFSCGKKQETTSSESAPKDSANEVLIVANPAEYTSVLDETMNNLAKKDVAAAVAAYADSITFVSPDGSQTHTKKEIESVLTARLANYSSIAYNRRVYHAFEVKKSSQKGVIPGVYVTGWMWSTVKNAKGDSVVTPMTLTMHFNKENKVDLGFSTYDLKGRSDMMAK